MSKVKVERVLVQGTVTFTVTCDNLMGLVTPEQAADQQFMIDWFADKAAKMLDLADEEVEFNNEVPVKISEETAQKFTGKIITNAEWKAIRAEHKSNENSA
jgi:dsDNA-binding SOS-regulon protein